MSNKGKKKETFSSRIKCYNDIFNSKEMPFWIYSEVIDKFMTMLGNIDEYTEYHCFRVAILTKLFLDYSLTMQSSEEINYLSNTDIKDIIYGAYVHDIGKSQVPSYIVKGKKNLTEDEWNELKAHPTNGAFLFLGPGYETVRSTILGHHERFDGKGYPMGESGKEITLGARIVGLLDSLDAMTDKRPYQSGKPLTINEAITEINKFSGLQFDPDMVNVLNELVLTEQFQAYWSKKSDEKYINEAAMEIKNWIFNYEDIDEQLVAEERNIAVLRKILNVKKR